MKVYIQMTISKHCKILLLLRSLYLCCSIHCINAHIVVCAISTLQI